MLDQQKDPCRNHPSTPRTGPQQDASDALYLCNFRVSVDGDWLCLREAGELEEGEDAVDGGGGGHGSVRSPQEEEACSSVAASVANAQEFEHLINYPDYPLGRGDRDPALIERSNLVNILKLVVREVLDSSLRFGRQLDSDHIPLQHFFIVLEHILRHGLKPKKGLLGPKKELWDLLQLVERRHPEAVDVTASARDLPTVRTGVGRARAWLRLAAMQKRLSDYVASLVAMPELGDFYEPNALLRSDESALIVGLLVSLNVVDCNICVKEEDLDSQQGVIDFSLYLRQRSSRSDPAGDLDDTASMATTASNNSDKANAVAAGSKELAAVLDQKSYVEELNRRLTANVGDLEKKLESACATNALMKEDLARAQRDNAQLMEQLRQMQQQQLQQQQKQQQHKRPPIVSNKPDGNPPSAESLPELVAERDSLRRELGLQRSMRAETEVAAKLLEKEAREKTQQANELRVQLDDIKKINLDMYIKLQECESDISQKGELVARLEAKTADISRLLEAHMTNKGKEGKGDNLNASN